MNVPEYIVTIVVEELDDNGDPGPDFVLSHRWDGGSKLIHGLTEADRIAKVLSAAQVPGA